MILPIVRREVTGASLSSDLHPVIDRIYRGRNIANLDDLENRLKGLTHFNVLKGLQVYFSPLSISGDTDHFLFLHVLLAQIERL